MHKRAKGAPPLFFMTVGEMSHSGELTYSNWWKHGISGGNAKWYKLRIHYKIMWILPSETGFPGPFQTLKPMSFRGLHPLDPRCHDGIPNGNSTNWQFSVKLHVNFTPDLTLWNGFSWAFKTLKPTSFWGLRPLDPWCHDGIPDENSTNWCNSAQYYM